jgi:hypothetical protein
MISPDDFQHRALACQGYFRDLGERISHIQKKRFLRHFVLRHRLSGNEFSSTS